MNPQNWKATNNKTQLSLTNRATHLKFNQPHQSRYRSIC